nr:hypothetical protein [uncultured Duganella sp.]
MQTEQRHNATLSAAVDHGIWLAESRGSAIAWSYMQAYHVPPEAIRRVLAYPETRRKRDSGRS